MTAVSQPRKQLVQIRGDRQGAPKGHSPRKSGKDRLFEIQEHFEKKNTGGCMAHLMEYLGKKLKTNIEKSMQLKKNH